MIYTLAKFFSKVFFRFWGTPRIVGLENIPNSGPIIVVANHRSVLDGFLLASIWPQRITFLAAAYLFELPVVRVFLRAIGAIPVQSGRDNHAGKKAALEVLQRGDILALFPEGRVYQLDTLGPFNLGWAHFALNSGASVVPVAIKGTNSMLPKGTVFPRRTKIYVQIDVPWTMEKTLSPQQETLLAMNTRLFEQMEKIMSAPTIVEEVVENGA
ncbi:MAG: lysophospholipid acyltransferase family protein [Bacillota bacterium]|nr:lysophospholipid acyltransferase family protein [Bacillota bacterium]